MCLLCTTATTVANAAMFGTQDAVAVEERAAQVSGVKDWLTQEEVKTQLVELGVNPANAAERISAMTAEELRTVNAKIEDLPAGGLLEVIGVIFVVLIILEIVGVTHIFSKV